MKILCITSQFPYPIEMGGDVRTISQLRALAGSHEVLLLSGMREDTTTTPTQIAALRADLGIEAEVFEPFGPRGSLRTWSRAFRRVCPPYIAAQTSDGLGRRLTSIAHCYDVVVALDDYAGACFDALDPQVPTVLDKHGIMASGQVASVAWRPRDVSDRLLIRFERRTVSRAGAVVTPSEQVLYKLRAKYRPRTAISVPNEPPRLDVVRTPDTTTVAWMGTHAYDPNRDGLERFLDEGWDQVGMGAVLAMIGKGPSPELRRRAAGRVDLDVLGFVDDLSAFMAFPVAGVVPIWDGQEAAKLKTLTFMEAGVPVVSTPAGIDGIDAQPGVHAIVGESPAELALGLRHLLANPEQAARIGREGQRLIRAVRDTGAGAKAFVDVTERVALDGAADPRAPVLE